MKFKSLGWLLLLLLAWFVFFVVATLAWTISIGWALGVLGVVWGTFLLADVKRWVPLRDLAWAAGVGYGFSVVRWLEVPVEDAPGLMRWLVLGGYALCLAFFALIAPALLGLFAQRFRPPAEPEPPVEAPASPEMLRRWDPKD
ncbi:hypothetical protein [Variovorax sp. PAMC26660]|uniref:hypothetical protein n=1 Tax=Variovorax sp. PAMC26660 TaxID=2762322 RepID=UPI00164E061C|nr:hypothetical protein [Variovorax sp. PAMC26660]QNK67814.1 hypothetical protein H7F35_32595 [Variovorax sp. PAMC26660]